MTIDTLRSILMRLPRALALDRLFSVCLVFSASFLLLMWISAKPAWASDDESSLTPTQARHLLVRTGFAPPPQAVQALVGKPRGVAIDELIAAAKARQPQTPTPTLTMPDPAQEGGTPQQRQEVRREQFRQCLDIKSWWMQEMLDSPAPLAERMTLFWHGHFPTSQQKVPRSIAIWNQQKIFRKHALAPFGPMLHAIAKDPAMLVYLDGANSRKEAPNENFAREVMELFTLGEASAGGGYSERDIKEAARAFTGWSIDRADFSYRFRPAMHDTGDKQVLGASVKTGEQVLDLLIAHPAIAKRLVSKLWKEFVSEQPGTVQERLDFDVAVVAMRSSGLDTSVALRSLLGSSSFWDERNRLALIKSPVDYIVGMVRQFGIAGADGMPLAFASAQFGQNLLFPPNVKGWPGNTDWINTTTLLERKRFAEQVFSTKPIAPVLVPPSMDSSMMAGPQNDARPVAPRALSGIAALRVPVDEVLAAVGAGADRVPDADTAQRLTESVLATQATRDIATGTVGMAYLRALVLDPAYQLK